MRTFRRWLRAQRGRTDMTGEAARALGRDHCNGGQGLRGITRHLVTVHHHSTDRGLVPALVAAYEEYTEAHDGESEEATRHVA